MTEHAYYHYGLSQFGRRFSWAKSLSVVRKHISLDSWTFAFLKAKIHNSIQIVTHKKCATFAIYQGFQRTSVKIKYPLVIKGFKMVKDLG